MPFKKIGLCDELVQGILATGYAAPTEIQAEAIPIVIAGKDMIGCAQTGTGKTAAFVLPILNRIAMSSKKGKKEKIRSLIITPTRELAVQIDRSVKGYGRFTQIKSVAVYGGEQIEKQIKVLRRGVGIVAATPGRLIDHLNRGTIDLSNVEVLVLDEADRMLDMGFINDIQKIIEKIPRDRQTLLFSATISKEVATLTKNIQRRPKMIQIGKQHNPIDTITQHIYPVPQEQKMELLLYMMERQQMFSVLIFSRTKRGADRICKRLKQNEIKAEAIHSDRTQRQRQRVMDGFKRGQYQVMVATDVAARGINVEGISHVFNFDVPAYAEDYVHRIGRTGRAEATGDAITFVGYDEIPHIRKIERFIGQTFKAEYYDGFDYKVRISLSKGPGGGGGGGGGRKKKTGFSQRKGAGGNRGGYGGGAKQKSGGGGGGGRGRKTGAGKREGAKREGAKREGAKREGAKREGVKREGVKREGAKPDRKKKAAGFKDKNKGKPKPKNASSKTSKKKTRPSKFDGVKSKKKTAGSKSKKAFKGKAKPNSGGKAGGGGPFKTAKRKAVKRMNRKS
ncbi:MAG: DEAD/DEAH box helicase [Planctomycetes bacterium]|nr:DEAD/DEAH box helicase [Planctomycetota bacterium]